MLHTEISVSLIRGGTVYWVQEQARLIRPDQWNLGRRLAVLVIAIWFPLLVLTAAHNAADLRAILLDYRVGSLVFVATPLLLLTQITVEIRFQETARHFLEADLVPFEQVPVFHKNIEKARRLRDAKLPEILIIGAVYLAVVYLTETSGYAQADWAIQLATRTPAGWYFLLITQPLFLVLLALLLWKWIIWIVLLRDLSRLDLQLDATDGDLCGGLSFLAEIPSAFVPAATAVAVVMGAAWRAQILAGRLELRSLIAPACVLAAIVLLVFFLPLLLFVPQLLREKREGGLYYGSLRHLHSLEFRAKWVLKRGENLGGLLGADEISSLADISTSFNNVEVMRIFPFRKETAMSLIAAVVIPLLPVVTTKIPLRELLKTLWEALH
jgi:hypothetical protein